MTMTPKTIALGSAGLVGSIGCFLPFLAGMSLSKLAEGPGFTKPSLLMFLIPFLVVLALGLAAGLTKRVARWHGIVGALFAAGIVMFLNGAVFHGTFKPAGFVRIFTDGDIGAKLIVIGGVVALVTCVMAAIKPDRKVA